MMSGNMARMAGACLGVAFAVMLSGCGGGKTRPVSGSVTVDGKTVRSGQLVFVGSDGQKHLTRVGFDGKYRIELPPGDYKVGVEGDNAQAMMKGMGGMAGKMQTIPKAPPGAPVMKDPSGQVTAETVSAKELQNPAVVPMRYRSPDASGLKVTVKSGDNTFDIPMKSKG